MATVETPDRVAFDQGYRSNCYLVGSDIETKDSVPHIHNYHNYDVIARLVATKTCHDKCWGKMKAFHSLIESESLIAEAFVLVNVPEMYKDRFARHLPQY